MSIIIIDNDLEYQLYSLSKQVTFNGKQLNVPELAKKSIIEFILNNDVKENSNGMQFRKSNRVIK